MSDQRKKRQVSTIDLLPDAVRRSLQELLADRRVTQLEAVRRINGVLAALREQGALPEEAPEKLSKSAVNRYSLDMEEAGRRLRQSREIAQVWIGKLGAAPQGQVGQLVNEILRTLSFDMALLLQRGEVDAENAPAVVEMLKGLSLTMQRLEQAANLNTKREQEIRKQALEEAANAVDATAKEAGVSAETIARIRRDVLRMAT
ncbi:DUF3486 family protein [Geoalkalibacter halelectricus]|uniref:DUF3486 family protein n=1 Tax=Geoalkalibacter halelectricus TaxID=2847045 RepID=UPI003D1AAAEE